MSHNGPAPVPPVNPGNGAWGKGPTDGIDEHHNRAPFSRQFALDHLYGKNKVLSLQHGPFRQTDHRFDNTFCSIKNRNGRIGGL
jgi:hypothetical protein